MIRKSTICKIFGIGGQAEHFETKSDIFANFDVLMRFFENYKDIYAILLSLAQEIIPVGFGIGPALRNLGSF